MAYYRVDAAWYKRCVLPILKHYTDLWIVLQLIYVQEILFNGKA